MGMNRKRMGPILLLRKYGDRSDEVQLQLFREDGAKNIPRHCRWARGVLAVETEAPGLQSQPPLSFGHTSCLGRRFPSPPHAIGLGELGRHPSSDVPQTSPLRKNETPQAQGGAEAAAAQRRGPGWTAPSVT